MQQWLRSIELVGLCGLPRAERSILRKAKKEKWQTRKTVLKNGGFYWEYHLSSLPAETQLYLLEVRENKKTVFPGDENEMANKRFEIVKTFKSQKRPGKTLFAQIRLFVREEKQMLSEQLGKVPAPQTVMRWIENFHAQGYEGLNGSYGKTKGIGLIEKQQPLKELILSMMIEFPHTSSRNIQRAIKARLNPSEIKFPSLRTIQNFIVTWKSENRSVYLSIKNPDAWKNRYMSAFGSASENVFRLNQRWELDSTPGDILLNDNGAKIRYQVIGVIDVFSRRGKLLISRVSSSAAISSVFRNALLDWGVPEEAKTDNGQDYTSKHLERVLLSLGVTHTLCTPFCAWEKPHIERFFRTFSHSICELLPGYVGHSVADRSAIEAKKSFAERLMERNQVIDVNMTPEEFQEVCDKWVENVYHRDRHSGLDNLTPFEKYSSSSDTIRRIEEPRALDMLLAPGGYKTVAKKGIRHVNGHYISPELSFYVGKRVEIRIDPFDLGRIHVFSENKYIGIAECPEYLGISREEIAHRAKELQREHVLEARRKLKQLAKKVDVKSIAREIINHQPVAGSQVLPFPKKEEIYQSAGLDLAGEAFSEKVEPEETEEEKKVFELAKKRIEKQMEQGVLMAPEFDTPFQRAWFLTEKQENKYQVLTGEETEFLKRFRYENPASAITLDNMHRAKYGEGYDL